jgi:alanyl-tRNA synthetase
MAISSKEIISKYIKFYEERGHKLIPNVSLLPEGDSTLLFVNSGMFPLVPYLSGGSHPLGKRLVNVQRSVRFEDLPEIGDARHTMAFHMIGNWSLGDYFKKDQLPWAYEFLIEHLGIDPKRLIATVFAGDKYAPKDEESIQVIKEIFKKYGIEAKEGERIFAYESNWWKRGDAVGELGGPDSEIYCYIGDGELPLGQSPAEHEDTFLEIGNSVFMQYKRTETGWEPLPQNNVDFGGGLERIALVAQNKQDIFETDNFWPIVEKVQEITGKNYNDSEEVKKGMRILADHMRTSVFMAMDGVIPSNKDQGYALRRILRRMVRTGSVLGSKTELASSIVGTVCEMFTWIYPQLTEKKSYIEKLFLEEELKFKKTLEKGAVQVNKVLTQSKDRTLEEWAEKSFDLYQSLGYPSEIFYKDLVDSGIMLDETEFDKKVSEVFAKHQEGSRAGAEKKFKGGLADHSEEVVKYHTTTHLLQWALRKVLGEHVRQLGSNITNERLRFDFPNSSKLTESEISEVEKQVNEVIAQKLPVQFVNLPKTEAEQVGALFIKGESYPDTVKVYFVGGTLENAVSKEFCGGPHVQNTSELLPIKIYKQESVGDGKQRVYAKFS